MKNHTWKSEKLYKRATQTSK